MQYFRAFACVTFVGVAAPVTAQTMDWSGFHAGGQVETASVTMQTSGGTETHDGNGLMIGVTGGYRFDLGNVVMGATGGAQFGSVDVSPNSPSGLPDPTLNTLLRAGIEVGYDLGPVLVTGGVGQTFAIMTDETDERESEFGSYFALGADYMLNEDIMVGAEVTRTILNNFGSSDVRATSVGIGAAYRF
jgi:opacity protein-like surface antigen